MSTRSRYMVVLFLACLLSAPVLLQSQSATALFEQALLKENAEGSLNEAIAIFSRIADDKTADPAIRARAQLHVGICYEKLGDAQARGAYERLIANFPQQTSEVTAARRGWLRWARQKRSHGSRRSEYPPDCPTMPHLLFPPTVSNSPTSQKAVSGSFPSTVQQTPRLPALRGRLHRRTSHGPKQPTSPGREMETGSLCTSGSATPAQYEYAVYMLRATGGEPRQVSLDSKSRERIFHDSRLSLSPDGKWLAYISWPEGESPAERSVYLAPTDGGPATRLTQPITSDPAFSPDGKRIAYLGLVDDPDWGSGRERGRQLWIKTVNGGTPVLAYELPRPGRIAGPTWSPDGRTVAVLVNRENRTDECEGMLLVPVGPDGRASGSPSRLTFPNMARFRPAGWSSGGQIGLISVQARRGRHLHSAIFRRQGRSADIGRGSVADLDAGRKEDLLWGIPLREIREH